MAWEEIALEQPPLSRMPVGSDGKAPSRSPYHAPVLRVHGSLGQLTQGTGSANGDAGQNMMA